jgi:hypothetical protein
MTLANTVHYTTCVCTIGSVTDLFSMIDPIEKLTIYHDLAVQNALIYNGHEQSAL